MASSCPLCEQSESLLIDEIEGNLLGRAYRRRLGVELGGITGLRIRLLECRHCTLRYYDPAPAGGEGLYEQLGVVPWYYLREKEEYRLAARHVGKDDSVLEIGAGEGAFAAFIDSKEYLGLELSAAAAQKAQEQGIDVRKGSIEDHARNAGRHYDCVCFFQVLEHIPELRTFLTACVSCVKTGGLLILSVPNEDSFLGVEANNVLNMPPHHVTRWKESALQKLGQIFGLELVQIWREGLSDDHVKPYARCIGQATLRKILRRKWRLLDPMFENILGRSLAFLLSKPTEFSLASATALRPIGHTIVAVYRK
jgi:2-polyprenyl-3-methyl-5-hydroxy-6-metoxy-1,4-benzoquinol methylase